MASRKQWSVAACLVVLCVLSFGWGYVTRGVKETNESRITAGTEAPLIDYINKVRTTAGLGYLQADPKLELTAKLKAQDMAEFNYWQHDRPNGESWTVLIRKHVPGSDSIGENLAECYSSYQATMNAWMASPGHKANIVNARFQKFGTYTLWDEDKKCTITVNHFGS